ncbi:MAG: hypothetical protein V4616_00260, partial [Bacteroidota bacterium]
MMQKVPIALFLALALFSACSKEAGQSASQSVAPVAAIQKQRPNVPLPDVPEATKLLKTELAEKVKEEPALLGLPAVSAIINTGNGHGKMYVTGRVSVDPQGNGSVGFRLDPLVVPIDVELPVPLDETGLARRCGDASQLPIRIYNA